MPGSAPGGVVRPVRRWNQGSAAVDHRVTVGHQPAGPVRLLTAQEAGGHRQGRAGGPSPQRAGGDLGPGCAQAGDLAGGEKSARRPGDRRQRRGPGVPTADPSRLGGEQDLAGGGEAGQGHGGVIVGGRHALLTR